MKKLICGLALALGLPLCSHAQGMKISAYPNTNNLAGTNLFLIAIVGSPGTNMNISYAQLSNLLAAAIGGGGGGAQVWTNDGQFLSLNGTQPSNSAPFVIRKDGSFYVGTNIDLDINITDYGTLVFPAIAMFQSSNQPGVWKGYWTSTDNENDYTYASLLEIAGAATAVNPTAAIKLESYTAAIDDKFYVLADPDSSTGGTQLFLQHDSTKVFQVNSNGLGQFSGGLLYSSNAVPTIPTAATLGAGGYWTGNSNGFLVTVYSLDGSTTVMKVLAP